MSEKQKKMLKQILTAIAIIFTIIMLYFAASQFLLNEKDDSIELKFYEYRIAEDEIVVTPETYTQEGVTVEITTQKAGLSIQYNLEGTTEWIDYTGPFIVEENVKLNARLVSAADYFEGPITSKNIKNISVAKIGDKYYKTLAEAIAACPENISDSQIKIEMLTNTSENVVIPEGKNIQLDLCGATLTSASAETEEDSGTGEGSGESTQAEATIIVNGKLNLIDSAQNEDGTLQGNGKVESNISAAIKVTDAGTLTLGTNEAEISVDKTNPVVVGVNCGVVIEEGGKFNFYDGKIQGVEGNSIVGNVSDIPDAYCVDKTTANGVEIAILGEVNYEVSGGATLADVVQVGDYVNYDASSNGTKTFTSSDCLTGTSVSATISTDDNFNSDAPAQWRVLSVDKTKGIVELMSADPTVQTVTLSGGNGFVNAESVLNNVGAIYGQGKGATGGRSITVEDVEQYSSYDKTTYSNSYSSTGYYGGTRNYTSGNFYKEIKDEEGNVTGYEDTTTAASSSSPVTMTQTYYNYAASSYFSNSTIYNMIFRNSTNTSSIKSTYWLASRCVYLDSSNCSFRVRVVGSGRVDYSHVFNSSSHTYSPANRVLPVVSLKSNILTTGQDESGVWQLKFEETTPEVNYYSTLQSAINNAPAGSTIKALNGIEETKAPTVPTEKGLVLDLNGKTTILKGVSLTNNGGLTITGEGKITSANANTIVNTGRLKKSGNGSIENTGDTGDTTVAITNTGMVNILEGAVIAKLNAINTTSGIVTLGVNDETVSINNPTITATDTGISIGGGKFNFYDGAVKGTSGKSIVGTITDMATNHGVATTISEEVETSILKRKIKVTFDANGGIASLENKYVITDMPYGSLPTVEEREGYSFLGWRNTNNQISTNEEDWESGEINIRGQLAENSNRLRLKNYLKVSPNTQYLLATNNTEFINPRIILFYDKDFNLIKYIDGKVSKVEFTTPENCEYIKLTLMKANNTTEGAPISVEDITKANIELYATITENTKVIEENNHTLKALWSEIVASTTINGVTTIYDSVQGAIDAAGTNEGARVTLLKNEIVESVTVVEGQDIVLDTNGKTLTSDTNTLSNYGNLVIDGTGTITSTANASPVLNKEEGNVHVINGNIIAIGTYSRAIISTSVNDVIIGTEKDTSIETPHIKGLIISENDGDIYVHSGLVEGTSWRALQGKKNIVVTGGKITVSGTVEHTYAIISASEDSVIDISGGIIESGNNIAVTTTSSLGGKILISGGEIYSENARAVQNSIGETEITGGTIKGEKGIFTPYGTLTITGGTINATTVGIEVATGEATVTGGTITAGVYGIVCGDSGKLVIGTDDGTVGIDSPLITGTSTADNEGFALHLVDAAECSFFDGKLIGKANSSIYGSVDVVPDGYAISKNAETIDEVVREVAYLEVQIFLADVVEVGDYVNYDASSNGVQTFTSSDCLAGSSVSGTISTDEAFNSEAPAQWRVLSVNKESGLVELMAADPTAQTVTLSGGDGFANSETVLNNIGAIYGNGKGAISGRSLKLEDIEQYSSYDKTSYSNGTYKYGDEKSFTSGNFYKEIKDENGNVTGYETTTTAASSSNPVTMTQTYYNYTASSYFSNSAIYNMIFKNSTSISSNKSNYWLASRCVYLFTSYCDLGVRNVNTGRVNYFYVYNSSGSANSPASMVVPVVSLKSNILTTGQDESGVWQLKIDETATQATTFSLRPQTNTTQVQENNESDVQNESIEPETSIEQENIEQTQPTPLAQIAETTYETLQSAINASNSEDEITILQDIALTEELTIPENKNIKLNLNNKTISSSSENVIKNNGTLTITKSGIIRNETSNGTVIYNTGTLNIENAIITTAQNGGKAVFNDSGIVNMISGKIVTEGISGIGIYNVNTGKVLIEDGIIEVTGTSSKCIYNDASLEITGGKIVVSGDDSIGIYNSDKSTKCIMNEVEILVEAEVIENYELIKNTQEFKAELEQMKPSYGIYNNSEINVEIETATIKVERLKGVGILNKLEGSVTLGIEDSEVSTATPIVYAISDNTTAIENSEDGNINFYDGRLSTLSSIKDVITKVLDGYELVEEIGENVVNATLKVIEVAQAVENTEAEGIDEQDEQMETTEVTVGTEATEGSKGTEGTEGTEITEGAEGSEVTEVIEGN